MFNQVTRGECEMADDPFAATSSALLNKTGKDLAAWTDIARKAGISRHMELVQYLKATHGLGHGHANTVAHTANQSAAASMADTDLLSAMFAGPKSAMKPVYDALIDAVSAFGDDIELAPKKGYVSLRRSKQFAIAQPSTKDRFDLGLNLKGEAVAGRLEASGSWNAMVSHRVRIGSVAEVDAELIGWLPRRL
jgi:hypothetical protein